MLDALAQAAGGGEADGCVGGARIGEVERAQRGAQPRPQRLAVKPGSTDPRGAEIGGSRLSAAFASGASSSAIPRFVFAGATLRDARTTADTVSPTPRSPARASSGPTAIALRSMST